MLKAAGDRYRNMPAGNQMHPYTDWTPDDNQNKRNT